MENLEVVRSFGFSIVKLRMSDEVVKEMNNYVDTIIKYEEKLNKFAHGSQFAGKVIQYKIYDYRK